MDTIDAAVATKAQAQVEKAPAGQPAAVGQGDIIAVEEGHNLLHGLHVLWVLGVVCLVALQQPLVRVVVHGVGVVDQRGHAAGGEDCLSPHSQLVLCSRLTTAAVVETLFQPLGTIANHQISTSLSLVANPQRSNTRN